MDDMLLIGNCKSDLYKAVKKIKEYIKPLGLEIKNSWEVKKIGKMDNDGKLEKGTYWIDICGYKFCRNCVILRDKIFLETRRDVKKIKKLGYSEHRCKSLISKIGWAKKANSYHFLWDDIKPYVNIKSVRRYISNVDKERKRRIDEAFNKRAVG